MTKTILKLRTLAHGSQEFQQRQAVLVERTRNAANNLPGSAREVSEELHEFADAFRHSSTSNALSDIIAEMRTWATRDDVAQAIEID